MKYLYAVIIVIISIITTAASAEPKMSACCYSHFCTNVRWVGIEILNGRPTFDKYSQSCAAGSNEHVVFCKTWYIQGQKNAQVKYSFHSSGWVPPTGRISNGILPKVLNCYPSNDIPKYNYLTINPEDCGPRYGRTEDIPFYLEVEVPVNTIPGIWTWTVTITAEYTGKVMF